MHIEPPNYILQISIFASKDVGKKTFTSNYTREFYFEGDLTKTIGVDFSLKDIEIYGKKVRLTFWRHSDEDWYTPFLKYHIQSSLGLIMMYDIAKLETLNWLSKIISLIKEYKTDDFSILLVGNKLDLEKNREIFKEHVEDFKEKYGIFSSMEVSVKTGENIEKMITEISKLIIEKIFPEFKHITTH